MSLRGLIEYIASIYTLEDVCYILGHDTEWLLWKIKYDILEHREDFLSGDDDVVGDYYDE